MFQMVFPSIRPSLGAQDCTYSVRYMSHCDIYLMLYVQSWTTDDGRKDCPKYVEWYSINSKNCASSWFYHRNISRYTVPWMSNLLYSLVPQVFKHSLLPLGNIYFSTSPGGNALMASSQPADTTLLTIHYLVLNCILDVNVSLNEMFIVWWDYLLFTIQY